MRRPRRILVDARTPVHYTMFAPVHAMMRDDQRVRFSFIASESPAQAQAIFADAGDDASIVGPLRAAAMRFDAYLTSDFTWTRHAVSPRRIQMFHGVGGKYGFDAPTESLRPWHRLFFVNRRRLENCVAAGALDADSPAIRLIGMPKVDCLVDGSLRRDEVLASLGLAADRPTVLYAPTWSPASSLNKLGIDLIDRLKTLPVNLIVKLHDRSRDPGARYSGGVDWRAAVESRLVSGRSVLATRADICPYLTAADVMVTDHSSCGFEYLLLDRPLVRIHVPELIELANIHRDYVSLLAQASESTHDVDDTVAAVDRALADGRALSATRRTIAADLFHEPGTATARCAEALYEVLDLEPLVERSAKAFALRPDGIALRADAVALRTDALSTSASTSTSTGTGTSSASVPSGVPSVTVIMPAHNAEPYLAEAIESVLAQTFTDYELIVVDDGSTDATGRIAERYQAAHPDTISVLAKPPGGVSSARNLALRYANGRFIALLDSDDGWDPTYLAEQMAILDAHPEVAIVTGNAWFRGGPSDGLPARPYPDPRPLPDLVPILRDETAVFIMTVFRREVVDRIGIFDERLQTNEDYDFWVRAALAGFRFTRNSTPLGFYRRHPGSLSSSEIRMVTGILPVYRKALAACDAASPARHVIESQLARFEIARLTVETKTALADGDGALALTLVDDLRARQGGWSLTILSVALRHATRLTLWLYHAGRQLRSIPRTLASLALRRRWRAATT